MNFPSAWGVRGVLLFAPMPAEVDRFVRFIDERLAVDRINMLVLIMRYRYAFETHPECRGISPLTKSDVQKIKAACDRNGIELIPKMNLFGHQGGNTKDAYEGLLRAYPRFDETPDKERTEYCRSLCPSDPECLKIVLDLAGEMADVFGAKTFHIGCDEVLEIAHCPRCREKSPAELFGGWVSALHDFLAQKGVRTMMWGDRLLDGTATGYGPWEASQNGTDAAIRTLPKDILICDWHYEDMEAYPSAEVFGEAGFDVLLAQGGSPENTAKFIEYAKKHDAGNIRGVLVCVWRGSAELIDALENPDAPPAEEDITSATYRALYM